MKTRSLRDLLITVLQNLYPLNGQGLCHKLSNLYLQNLIDEKEFTQLLNFIEKNPPSNYPTHCISYTYYWQPGDYLPRIIYLLKHIWRLS